MSQALFSFDGWCDGWLQMLRGTLRGVATLFNVLDPFAPVRMIQAARRSLWVAAIG